MLKFSHATSTRFLHLNKVSLIYDERSGNLMIHDENNRYPTGFYDVKTLNIYAYIMIIYGSNIDLILGVCQNSQNMNFTHIST